MVKALRFVPVLCAVGLVSLVLLAACQKVTAQGKAALTVAVGFTKARAVAFAAIQVKITAQDPKNASKVALFVVEHGTELNELADAMSHLNDAVVSSGSGLDDTVRQAVWEEARTSAERARNFKLMTRFLVVTDDIKQHQAGLIMQAHALAQLAELLPLSDKTVFSVTSNANAGAVQ